MSTLPVGTIVFDDVSKRYRLGALGSLRSTMAALSSRRREDDNLRDFWALKDVSFRVEPGESLGLIGPNGAGKTTTLKLLSNITRPTSGRIEVGGRLSSLIELGAGFHPELSGRDNIFLNGAILGLSRREIQRKLDEIIAFSELERFMDTPVKRYSSGMYVRLGFAVAAYVEPDVLLVDEVLAVGDSSFRQKCMARMEELRNGGTTIVFVSHNMYQVRRLSRQTLVLINGKVHFVGQTDDAIKTYEQSVHVHTSSAIPQHKGESLETEVFVTQVIVADDAGKAVTQLSYDQPLCVNAWYHTRVPIEDPIVKLRLNRADGVVCAMTASQYAPDLKLVLDGSGVLSVRFDPIQLVSASYVVEVRIIDSSDTAILASGQSEPFFVYSTGMPHEIDRGVFVPHVTWLHEKPVSQLPSEA